jgi:hypothetical protein
MQPSRYKPIGIQPVGAYDEIKENLVTLALMVMLVLLGEAL